MKSFLIIGMGRFGTAVAEELIALGHDVVAIERRESVGQQMADSITHMVIGDAKEDAVLRTVGVRNFDCVVLAMTSIEDSIMITLALKEMGAGYIVAKARSPQHIKALLRVGADRAVFPERDMGIRLAQTVAAKRVIDCIDLTEEDAIMEMEVPRRWVGRSLLELDIRKKYQVNVLAVREGGAEAPLTVEVDPERAFQREDIVFLIGKRWKLKKLDNL